MIATARDQLLTPHFSLREFAVSRDYPQLAAAIEFSPEERERLRFACAAILEPLRRHFGKPVAITSGKRSIALNHAVGGHADSHHLFRGVTGAVDLAISGVHPADIAAWLTANVRIAYLIVYGSRGFVHLSFPTGEGEYNLVHYLP